jgi:hypothetical protein
MLSNSNLKLRSLEDAFYEFCLLYFDDIPNGESIIIKIPAPLIGFNEGNVFQIISQKLGVFFACLLRLILIRNISKIEFDRSLFVRCKKYFKLINNVPPEPIKYGFTEIKITTPKVYINSIRRFIFVNRFT